MAAGETLPPAVTLMNEGGASPYVLICEHASRFIPPQYDHLGLPEGERARHIAWDIGAADVARRLSARLDAPLVLAGYSRLLIDLNRPVSSPTSIPLVSETTPIPGNMALTDEERQLRVNTYFAPFQSAVSALLDARRNRPTKIIGVHSFTPVYKGVPRPWHAGILFRKSAGFGKALADALGGAHSNIAENQPYQIEDDGDYTVPMHGEARGLDAVLIELRQDLVASDDGAGHWAERLSAALSPLASRIFRA